MKKITLFLLAFICTMASAFGQFNGTVDSSFADNGVLLYDHNGNQSNEFLSKAQFGPDGKLYLGGFIQGQNRDIFLLRFNADGTPDATFGNNGAVQLDPSLGGNDELTDFVVAPNGKIVVVGTTTAGNTDQIVVRFNADGTLDETFYQTGYRITGGPGVDTWHTVWVDGQNGIIAAGNKSDGQNQNLVVTRFNPNGSLDGWFGMNSGSNEFDFTGSERFLDIHWHDFSKRYYLLAKIGGVYFVGTLTEDGLIDNSFNANGWKSLDLFLTEEETFTQILTGPNGDIFLAGAVTDNSAVSDALVVKLYNTGDLYAPFADNGIYRANLGASASDLAGNIHFLNDGSLVVSGTTVNSGKSKLMTFMLASDGFFISNYGQNGVREYAVQNNVNEYGGQLCIDNTGDVYVYGTSVQPGHDDMVIVKLKTSLTSSVKDLAPTLTSLEAWPNPAFGQLTIAFDLPAAANVQIALHSLTGQRIAALFPGHLPAGPQAVDGTSLLRNAVPGMYLLRIQADGQVYTQKIAVQ